MENGGFVWALFVATSSGRFPNFYPVGIYSSEYKAKEELERLPKDNNYQLLKLPMDHFFGYYNKKGQLVGMDNIQHWHYHYQDDN
ncbi:hypothetical protein AM500_04510 [Bacillus sp. FJAT-18017]|uniref:hypothetical protein n=1 Tax=Bacillus sp. FJAT-18017 TaxID=1705566 RepID=UPI0006AE52E3|nr:hypothetical protein [Bacillus sp. FJAT-18017]ALC89135.1 hypothetical protein AM500_04510 [Bacillus sp. FJAT-18017]